MALNLKDRVKETCAAPGTGTITLLGPAAGFAAFSTVGTGNTTYYAIVDPVTYQWEVGTGTWTTGGSYGTLARTTVLSNSLGTTALINFSSGTQDVFITLPSQFAVTNVSVATANGFSGTTAVTASVPSLTLKTTITGMLYGNGTSGAVAAAAFNNGLTYNSGTLSGSNATASAVGVMYGATGNTTANINNTGLGFNHVIGGSVINSTIIGNNANITNVGGTSYTTRGGVAVGYLAKTTNLNSVSIGASSAAISGDSVVVGANATLGATAASYPRSIAIGSQARTTDTLGTGSRQDCVVIGTNAVIDSSINSIGIGSNVSVTGDNSVVIGFEAYTGIPDNYDAVVIGSGAGVTGLDGTAVGTNSSALEGGTAVGRSATAANRSLALGYNALATVDNSIVLSASGTGLTPANQGVFIDSMRDESAGSPDKTLKYNSTTKEIFYGAGGGGSGSVTNVSVVAANGFTGSVANSTTTPAITLGTGLTGLLRGTGTAIATTTIGTGLNFTGSTLNATAATRDALGVVYAATGTDTTNVNNTGVGYNHIINTSVVNSTIIGNNANVSQIGTSSFTARGGVSVGYLSKATSTNSVAIGASAVGGGTDSVVIGANATIGSASSYTLPQSIVIGSQSRITNSNSVFGNAGNILMGVNGSIADAQNAIALGTNISVVSTGNPSDGVVAIGENLVVPDNAAGAVIIGSGASLDSTTSDVAGAVAILGNVNGSSGIAIGGAALAGCGAVAISTVAQAGNNSIAIGQFANATTANSIVLTAQGSPGLSAPNTGVFIDTIRDESAGSPNKTLKYNTTTKEIFYGTGGGGSGTVSSVDISGGTTGLTATGGPITTTGTITLGGTLGAANGGTGLTSLGTGVATFLGTPSSANLAAAVTDETGSGALVFATSPTLVTPILGTPTSGNLTNTTGYPTANLSGLGTGVATALAVNTGSAGAFVTLNGSLGTPSSGVLSGCTVDGTNAVGFRNVPVNSQPNDYTTVLSDSGKNIYRPTSDSTARTYTINGSIAYDIGTVITFVNMGSANNVAITITTDTMYLIGSGSSFSRTLARYGMATATKVESGIWVIAGSGLT